MGRSFQRTNIFPKLTVFENVQAAFIAHRGARREFLVAVATALSRRNRGAARLARARSARPMRSAARCPTATRSSSSSASRWPAIPRSCCSTSRPPACRRPRRTRRSAARADRARARADAAVHRARHGGRVLDRAEDRGAAPGTPDRRRAHPRRCAATPRCAASIWEQRHMTCACSRCRTSTPPTAERACCSACRSRSRQGECVCLLGRNGVGKTTTMRSIMGLTPPSRRPGPLEGQGHHRLAAASRRARLGIGFVPEDRRIFAELTVVGESRRRAPRVAARPGPWTIEAVFELFPEAARAARPRRAAFFPAASSRC